MAISSLSCSLNGCRQPSGSEDTRSGDTSSEYARSEDTSSEDTNVKIQVVKTHLVKIQARDRNMRLADASSLVTA